MSYKKQFSIRLRELRITKNTKQRELGQVVGISEAAIAQRESDRRGPSMETAIALADYFNVSLDYLVGRSNDSRKR